MKCAHKKWVEVALKEKMIVRDDKWTKSIAVGRERFIDDVKSLMGFAAIGRRRSEAGGSYQLCEDLNYYGDLFGGKKSDIAFENTYDWG